MGLSYTVSKILRDIGRKLRTWKWVTPLLGAKESWSSLTEKKSDIFSCLDTINECDERIDRRTTMTKNRTVREIKKKNSSLRKETTSSLSAMGMTRAMTRRYKINHLAVVFFLSGGLDCTTNAGSMIIIMAITQLSCMK